MIAMFALSLACFALLGWLVDAGLVLHAAWACGPNLAAPNDALALLLLLLVAPVFGFFVSPLFARLSRRARVRGRRLRRDAGRAAATWRRRCSSCTRTTPRRSRPTRCTCASTTRTRRPSSASRALSAAPPEPSTMTNLLAPEMPGRAPQRDERRRRSAATSRRCSGWHAADGAIEKTFAFKNYLETIAFVERAGLDRATSRTTIPTCASASTAASCASRPHSVGGISRQRLHLRRQGRCASSPSLG